MKTCLQSTVPDRDGGVPERRFQRTRGDGRAEGPAACGETLGRSALGRRASVSGDGRQLAALAPETYDWVRSGVESLSAQMT